MARNSATAIARPDMTPEEIAEILRPKSEWKRFLIAFKKGWQLHLMMLLPVIYWILFEAAPLYGLQIVFRDYTARKGIMGSDWVGLYFFKEFFRKPDAGQIIWNTMAISLYSICCGFPIPIMLALIIHINEHKGLRKIAQNVSYVPHFISVVVMVGILNQVFNPVSGIVGAFNRMLGISTYVDIRTNKLAFRHLYVWSGIWQGMGWSSIIYLSALSSVSQDLHEAAKIDGASRFRRVLAVDLPAIAPTIAIMLILRFGSILSVGYEKVYLMQNSLNISRSEVISTYVYKYGLGKNNLSFGSAVGIMNSVVNTSMIILVNKVANWLSDGEAGLF